MPLVDLSPELILSIASYLRQVDLLNVALVCKRLQATTEPELYREYSNPRLSNRPIVPFVKRVLQDDRFARCIKKLDLRGWNTLDRFNPLYSEVHPRFREQYNKAAEFDEGRKRDLCHEPSMEEYMLYTTAACDAGIISEVLPYEAKSRIVEKVRPLERNNLDPDMPWYDFMFDDGTTLRDLSFDRRFCHILRAGLEDPLVILVISALPNVSEILMRAVSSDTNALEWPTPKHQFSKLRRITALTDGPEPFPIFTFNPLLAQGGLNTFEAQNGSSWLSDLDDLGSVQLQGPPLTCLSNSLQLKKLELVHCCLHPSDLRCLVKASPSLINFYYTTGDAETGPYTLSPALMIQILGPLKDTLEELCLEMDTSELDADEDGVSGLIESLTHFTALRLLSTSAEMWRGWEIDVDTYEEEEELPAEQCLARRLPRSLEVLLFQLSGDEVELSLNQVQHILRTRAELLPCLKQFRVDAKDVIYLNGFECIVDDEEESLHQGPLELSVGIGGAVKTAFGDILPSRRLPDLKWFGKKYAIRKCKPRQLSITLDRIMARHNDPNLSEDEVCRRINADPEMQLVARDFGPGSKLEEPTYDSSDEEFPAGAVESTYQMDGFESDDD